MQKNKCTTGRSCDGTGSLCLEFVARNTLKAWCYCGIKTYGTNCKKSMPRPRNAAQQARVNKFRFLKNRSNMPESVKMEIRKHKVNMLINSRKSRGNK
jgi:hypothetical protein